jgi:dimethylaniline monooxygenase (N-oxide forming)
MYPPELAEHNTLALVGLIQPLGSIMPISEMQARLFFDALTGGTHLPAGGGGGGRDLKQQGKGMRARIASYKQELASRYVDSRRHTIQVLSLFPSLINKGIRPPLKSLRRRRLESLG